MQYQYDNKQNTGWTAQNVRPLRTARLPAKQTQGPSLLEIKELNDRTAQLRAQVRAEINRCAAVPTRRRALHFVWRAYRRAMAESHAQTQAYIARLGNRAYTTPQASPPTEKKNCRTAA